MQTKSANVPANVIIPSARSGANITHQQAEGLDWGVIIIQATPVGIGSTAGCSTRVVLASLTWPGP